MSDIYLIRHGFTPANNASYNGQEGLRQIAEDPNMPLDVEYGVPQALEIGEFLSNLKGNNLVIASPYRRVQETMKYALSKVDFKYDIEINNDIKEISSGVHYARTKQELLNLYPEASKVYEGLNVDPLGTRYLYGESQEDVKKRVKDFSLKLLELSKSNKYDNIIVFGHGTVNRWISYWVCGDYIGHILKNGEIIKIKNNKEETVFLPNAFAPQGYMVDIEKHKKL